jgi:hypothetical protein
MTPSFLIGTLKGPGAEISARPFFRTTVSEMYSRCTSGHQECCMRLPLIR